MSLRSSVQYNLKSTPPGNSRKPPVTKKLKDGEILVKIEAAALNPVGWKMMRYYPNAYAKRLHVVEHDFSGVVVNANGTGLNEGDNVFGWIPRAHQRMSGQGVLAQYATLGAEQVVIRPASITPTQAAGVTLAAMTAYQAQFGIAKLEAEQTIFINGGSPTVGTYAIQLVKIKGAKVVATASARNEAFVRKMGADEFIDYTKEPLVAFLTNNPPPTKYSVIFDAAGLIDPSLFTHSAKYLAPGGVFISTGPLPHGWKDTWKVIRTIGAITIPSWLGNVNRHWVFVGVKNNAEDLKEIQKKLANGSLQPIVDSMFAFEDALKAYDRILTARAVGKVVVKVD